MLGLGSHAVTPFNISVWLAGDRQSPESSYILTGWIIGSFLFAPNTAAMGRADDTGAQQACGISVRQALRSLQIVR
jgi:hypothetical protein